MKTFVVCAALLGIAVAPVSAENRYDRKLEQAAIDIAVAKLGNLRGGLAFDAKGIFITVQDLAYTGPAGSRSVTVLVDPWKEGLAPAVEGKAAPIVF